MATRRKKKAPEPPKEEEEKPLEPEVLAAEEPEAPEQESASLPVPVERDLTRADALQRYMAEVSRHPLLSREEEHKLAAEFHKTRDPDIAYKLVTANLRLVV